MSENRFYSAVCAGRRPEGHERCERALDVPLDGGTVAHFCACGALLGACLVDVFASELAPTLERIAAAAGNESRDDESPLGVPS